MFRHKYLFVAILLALSTLETARARRGGGSRGSHSYPSSHGLSGSGHHSSGSLSGGSHSYPSSSGSHSYPSSSGSHSYPSGGGSLSGNSGGSHSYPSSGGRGSLSGNSGGSNSYPSSGGSHTYPSSSGGSHTYPSGGTHSMSGGSHSYPPGKGLSGGSSSSSTVVHHHYHYSPPTQIKYTPRYGSPVIYPVYRGTPPTYVYQYQDSGSKYSTLLAGLALFNLGALAGNAYGHSHSNVNSYKGVPGEICKFGIKKDNGDYEETRIQCDIISSFIYQEQAKTPTVSNNNSTTIVTTTVTNVTTVNNGGQQTPPQIPGSDNGNVQMLPNGTLITNVTQTMLPNGMLVPVNVTSNGNVNVTSVTTVTNTTTTTVANALDVKGPPIAVTPTMECYVIRQTSSSRMKKSVPCGVLQTYATQSLKRNSAYIHKPVYVILSVAFVLLALN